MYGHNKTQYQEWVAEEWASEDPARDRVATAHWTKDEWVGDQGHGLAGRLSAAEMPEGERGLSGFRHTGPAAQWASSL
jgi:hypothetical protein